MTIPTAANQPSATAETIRTMVYALLIAFGIRSAFFEPFNIPSGSMEPTLLVGDYLFVSKFTYGYSFASLPSYATNPFTGRVLAKMPARGDVAVFRLPRDPKIDYIKRVMGLPGDRIQVIRGVVHINGAALVQARVEDFQYQGVFQVRVPQFEETLPDGRKHMILRNLNRVTDEANNTPEYVVPDGHFFMMGDNRDNSVDSRFQGEVGFVPFDNLVGQAQFLFFSTDGTSSYLLPWTWLTAARYPRLFNAIR